MTTRPRAPRQAGAAAGLAVGLLLGAGAFLEGLYDFSAWGIVAVGCLTAVMAWLVVGGTPPSGAARAPALALIAFAAVQLASVLWAESIGQALVDGLRWGMYAALFWLLCLLARDPGARLGLVAGVAGGAVLVAGWDVVRLAAGEPDPSLFLRGRLDEPLGYSNGQAAVLLAGFWPLVAAAEAAARRAAGGLAAAGASLLLSVSLLSSSRGAIVALAATTLVVMAVLPGRGRRAGVLAIVAAGAIAAYGALSAVYDSTDPATGVPLTDKVHAALLTSLAVAAAAGLAWAALGWLRPLRDGLNSVLGRRSVRAGLVAGALAVVVAGGAVSAGRIGDAVDDFTSLTQVQGQSRLTSGGGNRYDYWRIAVEQFKERPLLGIGAGNYDVTYFRERRTTEDVRQPHSLPLQALAESGLLGGLALLAFAVAIGAALARARTAAREGAMERGLLVGAAGILVMWAVHTSVDWLHLLPTSTGAALAAAAAIVAAAAWPPRLVVEARRPRVRPLAFAACTVLAAAIGISLLARSHREDARDVVAQRPAAAIDEARRSLELNRHDLETYYVLAAAQARLNRYAEARATLQAAARREPHDFVPPALLGDLATRAGDDRTALRDYERALSLNPREPALEAAVEAARERAGKTEG